MNRKTRGLAQAGAAAGLIASVAGCFGNGVHRIGSTPGEVNPGLYTSAIPLGGLCSVERKVVNDIGDAGNDAELGGRSFIQLLPTDAAVISTGCGVWDTPKPTSYNPDRATAKVGMYRVPTDLLPGTYTAPGGPECAWERVSSFRGDPKSIIAENPQASVHPTVTIAKTDAGFVTNPCGGWRRVGP